MGGEYKKSLQLGMHSSTAQGQLRKKIMFDLLKKLEENYCFQCGAEIESEEELSIEHKVPWIDSENPQELFFDLDNIGFSHLKCNIQAARQTKETKHPSWHSYKKGCRCDGCKAANYERVKNYRKKKTEGVV